MIKKIGMDIRRDDILMNFTNESDLAMNGVGLAKKKMASTFPEFGSS